MTQLVPQCLLIVALCCCLLSLLPHTSFAQAVDPLDGMSRALRLAEQGDVDGARATLDTLPQAESGRALSLAARGSVELSTGNVDAAEPLFRAALAQDPQQLAALWGASLCLLQRARLYEAATLVDRAATVAPDDTRVKTLRAYVYLQLGQLTDAGMVGKAALDGGEKSPFLMATLAQMHARLGFLQKAVEFGGISAKYLYGLDLRAAEKSGLHLPLMLTSADTPAALSNAPATPAADIPALATMQPPATPEATGVEPPLLEIVSPAAGSQVQGMQRVQVVYRGHREVTFATFLVDGALRGMVTELPYHFPWDADAVPAGTHQLTVRTYDNRGLVVYEHSITVTSTSSTPVNTVETSAQVAALQGRMVALTMPTPTPLPLFTNLARWHLELREIAQATTALEKSVAIDPSNAANRQALVKLYEENGLHPISPTGEVTRGPATGQKRVALTFDDGPNPLYTPTIIAELAKYDAHCTFFLVGKMVQRYPDHTLQLLAAGHELANHTYNHPNLTTLPSTEIIREALLARSVIKDITGRDTYLFRPPGGNIDENVTREFRALDYNIVYWSLNAGEYVKNTPADQAAQLLARVQDGSILLLHNGPVDGTMAILPTLLSELHRRNFTFVTVTELLRGKPAQ